MEWMTITGVVMAGGGIGLGIGQKSKEIKAVGWFMAAAGLVILQLAISV